MRKCVGQLVDTEGLNDLFLELDDRLTSLNETTAAAQNIGRLWSQYADPKLRVVVFGEFNRGKSTLINALLGRVALPASLVPTTGHITRVVAGSRDEVRSKSLSGKTERCSMEELDRVACLNAEGVTREDIDSIEVSLNAPLLRRGLVLIDTPGVNDSEAQSKRARRAIAEADIVLFVLRAERLLTQLERQLAVEWLGSDQGRPVVPVVNFMNLVPERDRMPIRERLDSWCEGRANPVLGRSWFEVNALGALQHALGDGPPIRDDFKALLSGLRGLTGDRRVAVQRRSRCGQLVAEVRELQSANKSLVRRLRADSSKLSKERAEKLRQLQELGRRFDALVLAEKDRMLARSQSNFNGGLEKLSQELTGQTKESLKKTAQGAFQTRFTACVKALEEDANRGLRQLVGPGIGEPLPMTVSEALVLKARIQVGELKPGEASDNAVGGGGVVGAVLGQILIPIPGLGALVGVLAGGFLASIFGATPPDYAAAYIEKSKKVWNKSTKAVIKVAEFQHAARCQEMRRELDEALANVEERAGDGAGKPAGAKTDLFAAELRERKRVGKTLTQVEALLVETIDQLA